MRVPISAFRLCMGSCLYFFDLYIIGAEVIHKHITLEIAPGPTMESFPITVAETMGAVAEVSMTMSEASVETAMAESSVCAKLTVVMNSSAAPTASLPQLTPALAQIATQSTPVAPPTMTAALGNTNAVVNIAQSTAIAAGAGVQPLASPLLSPCDCQCMCPSAGFPLAANLSVVIATPEFQMSTFQSMASVTSAGQASLQSSIVQPAATSIMMTQQVDMASSAISASSTPAVATLAPLASAAADPSAPQPGAANTMSITLSADPLSSSRTTIATAFNIITYPLSSAVTAPIILKI